MEDLPPEFRFYPTEEELITFYLLNKLEGKREDLNLVMDRVIPVLDIYDFDPWDLPQLSGDLCYKDPEQWFFFNAIQERESCGGRPKRLTSTGYWKSTGSPGYVYSSKNRCIGVKRTMVFYKGRDPNGRKTEWKMNEYKAIQRSEASSSSTNANPVLRHEYSLCRVYNTSKYRRAFDRRPVGLEISQPRVAEVGGNLTITHQNPPLMGEGRSTHESSLLQEYGNSESSNNMVVMPIDNEPIWDWEHLSYWDYDGKYIEI
uniref:NAC transcription factor 040 n=1 Tax=Jatropha curcas TaxID=180498 RepID=R4NES7_JATCU|nr:NAC transcription factor 040 [Jatropha curcas]